MTLLEAAATVLRGEPSVRLAYAFGSVVHGTARPGSDLDLAVLLDEPAPPRALDVLADRLAAATRHRVDLVRLERAPPLLLHEVIARGRLLVARDDAERVGFEARAAARHLDTAHLRRVQHAYLVARSASATVVALRGEVVRAKLRELASACARLRSWQPVTRARLETDLVLPWAVERGLQLAAELVFDTGNHILAGAFADAADEHREVPVRLCAHGVITPATLARLAGLAGFRNVLVHDDARVDLERVVAGLDRLDDLEAFAADVVAWLASREA